MKRLVLIGLSLLILAATAEAIDKVRMSISAVDVSFLTGGLALKRGMFRDEGLDVELIRMNANVSVTALSTGDIDNTIRDLKGKTLAVSNHGATSDVAARMMMKQGGVDPEKELKIIQLGAERGRYAALREGIVDVAVLSPPTDTDAQRQGYRILSRFHEHFKLPFTGVGTNLRKLKEKPDEVKRMVKAMLRANRFVRSNREGTIQTMMEWIKVDRESAVATYDSTWKIFSEDGGLSESGLKLVIDQGREAMKIERPVANSEVADFNIIREVQKELGIKAR